MTELEQKVCEIADILMKEYDPCKWNGDACLVGNPSPCCIHTRFGKNGCPFSKDRKCIHPNAHCKLWFCYTAVKSMDPKVVEAFTLLERFGNLFGFVGKPFIGQGYRGADR